jgi:hypothetical protein
MRGPIRGRTASGSETQKTVSFVADEAAAVIRPSGPSASERILVTNPDGRFLGDVGGNLA